MTKTGTSTYRYTVTLKSSHTGTLTLKVWARDSKGVSQATYLKLPLG
jgi:hypothetical protein